MDDEIILLDKWASPFAMRVRIALAEKGIDYESREENLFDKSPLLVKMNPVKKLIPVLIHNGKPVCESLVIVEYIDEVWKHSSPLLPCDSHQRAHAKFWADFLDKKIYSLAMEIWLPSSGEVQEATKNELIECFKLLEGELGDKPNFGGETFGFVDVALIPFSRWFYTFQMCGNFSMEAECSKIVAWAHRCMKKKSVSKSIPDQYKVHDFIMEIKKKLAAK